MATEGFPGEREKTVESSPEELQQFLVSEAKDALEMSITFEGRNDRMAKAVGQESGLLAAKSVNKPEAADRLVGIFTQASVESGQTFAPAFDEAGRQVEGKDKEYKGAMNAAGEVALRHLPEALQAAGIEGVDINELLGGATFDDILKVTAEQLGVEVPDGMKSAEIKKSLHESAKGDYFEDQIDSLPFGKKGAELSDQEKQALDISVRLANATWKVGQVHRAAWEGNNSRIDPAKREAFNPFDLLKKTQYEGEIKKGRTLQEALARVALEVYKDVLQYKPLVEKK